MNQLLASLTELLRRDGKIWVVFLVATLVLMGWLYYFLQIGQRVRKLERRVKP